MKIDTHNILSIAEKYKQDQQMMQLKNITWFMVGFNKTHTKRDNLLQLKVNKHLLYKRDGNVS